MRVEAESSYGPRIRADYYLSFIYYATTTDHATAFHGPTNARPELTSRNDVASCWLFPRALSPVRGRLRGSILHPHWLWSAENHPFPMPAHNIN